MAWARAASSIGADRTEAEGRSSVRQAGPESAGDAHLLGIERLVRPRLPLAGGYRRLVDADGARTR